VKISSIPVPPYLRTSLESRVDSFSLHGRAGQEVCTRTYSMVQYGGQGPLVYLKGSGDLGI
jgi:hypothetical protein